MSKRAREVIKDKDVRVKPIHYPFWFGGSASCMAACVTHPLDLVKVRLQTQSHELPRKNMLQMFTHIGKTEGARGLYMGLSASILRQLTYSTARFGIYEDLKQRFPAKDQKNQSFLTLFAMSCFAGFVGGIAGTPADIMNVRMQNDAAAPPEKRRNYKHAIDGIIRTAKSEGVAALWKGWLPNSTRAMLMTAGQLASYDTFKSLLLQNTGMKDNLTTHFTASVMAGFVATTIASPVDVIKTRIMSATESVGIITLIKETTKKEGLFWMYRGFVPSFMRLGPQTIFTFVFLEQHKKVYRHLKGTES